MVLAIPVGFTIVSIITVEGTIIFFIFMVMVLAPIYLSTNSIDDEKPKDISCQNEISRIDPQAEILKIKQVAIIFCEYGDLETAAILFKEIEEINDKFYPLQ